MIEPTPRAVINPAVPVQFERSPDAGVPSAGAVKAGDPVQLEISPDAGVPNAGVTKTGDVAHTTFPLPVVASSPTRPPLS
jgi:hypothetical protein